MYDVNTFSQDGTNISTEPLTDITGTSLLYYTFFGVFLSVTNQISEHFFIIQILKFKSRVLAYCSVLKTLEKDLVLSYWINCEQSSWDV